MGHGTGGRPAERLLHRLGMAVSDDTILRQLKRASRAGQAERPLRVVGIDDWAWSKGYSYGTILVDLVGRTVADVLPDRSSASVASWLDRHPGVEIVCRDRDGLYAEGTRLGAPRARQVADRFHLIRNLRERLEEHLSLLQQPIRTSGSQLRGADQKHVAKAERRAALEAQFAQVHNLYRMGMRVADIARQLKLNRRRLDKWVRLEVLPERNGMELKPSTPASHHAYLVRRRAEGVTTVRCLFDEIRPLGYTGSFSQLARYLADLRRQSEPADTQIVSCVLPSDPTSGTKISPLFAAMLCMKPRPLLTPRQMAALDALKDKVPGFSAMRSLSLRFQALLRSGNGERLDGWIADATKCGIRAMEQFAKALKRDFEAVRNAIIEPWSNGQTEGQINRLKMLKRAMYGRPGVELLRARLLPASNVLLHQT
jgi:transposase